MGIELRHSVLPPLSGLTSNPLVLCVPRADALGQLLRREVT